MGFRVLSRGILISVFCASFAALAYAQQRSLSDYRNNLAPYVVAPERAVDKMLEMANPKPGETLYDLGCGDGRILITAAQRYNVKAVGIEIAEHQARIAAENVKKAGLQDRVKVIHGDFMRTDLSAANIITLYLAPIANDTLRPNLERYLRPHTRVVSYDYPIPGWKPMDTAERQGHHRDTHMIYLYEVPDSIKK
jgi:predicted O-methyltransferase YrrM